MLLTIAFFLFIIVPGLIYFCFSKAKSVFKLGIIFGVTHFSFAVLLTILLLACGPEAEMGFPFLFILDFPVSLLMFLTNAIFLRIGSMYSSFWIPAAVSIIFGSLQYFFIGIGIGFLYNRIRRRTQSKEAV
jgi:hypothetical protein